jgi:hypothetical protein
MELIGLGAALMATMAGCVGYVDGGYGGGVVVEEPGITVFGGGFDRGGDARAYSHRGGESRAVARAGGGDRGGKH